MSIKMVYCPAFLLVISMKNKALLSAHVTQRWYPDNCFFYRTLKLNHDSLCVLTQVQGRCPLEILKLNWISALSFATKWALNVKNSWFCVFIEMLSFYSLVKLTRSTLMKYTLLLEWEPWPSLSLNYTK